MKALGILPVFVALVQAVGGAASFGTGCDGNAGIEQASAPSTSSSKQTADPRPARKELAGERRCAFGEIAALFTQAHYLPGPYDAFAVTLSAMASTASIAGLLVVPIGALWLIFEFRKPAPAGVGLPPQHKGFAFASMAVASLIGALVSVIALASMGPSLALGTMALWVYAVSRTLARLKRPKQLEVPRFNPTPLYLILVPTTVVLLRWVLAGPATEFSRNRAIANSAQFIHDMEQYHRTYGHYPRSLLAEWKDYRPMVIGISEFHYEPNGQSYNVFFEQPTFRFGTRELWCTTRVMSTC